MQGCPVPDHLRDPATGRVLFAHHELACEATGVVRLAPGFGAELIKLRAAFGKAMTVSSCCRSAAHNRAVRGNARSLHVYDEPAHPTGGTCAIDIRSQDAAYAAELVMLAMAMGWSVGVATWGVHLDRRGTVGLPQAVFGYGG